MARTLRDKYGFILADHSLSIVAGYLAQVEDNEMTTKEVYENKSAHRQALQAYGANLTYKEKVRLIKRTLKEWNRHKPYRPVVFDNVRTIEEAEILSDLGFAVVRLLLSQEEQLQRAIAVGIPVEEFRLILAHPVEQGAELLPEVVLNVDGLTPDQIAHTLVML